MNATEHLPPDDSPSLSPEEEEEEELDYIDASPNAKLTADDLASLQKAGLAEDDAAGIEMVIIESNTKEGQEPRKRTIIRKPDMHISPATVCMVNPQRGLELMQAFEKREKRKGLIASGLGYILVITLCGICSWITIQYGQQLFGRVGTEAAKGFLASWGMSIVWDLGVMEWIAAGRKFAIKIASASVLTVLIGAYSLSNWYEDYSDFTTIDMMAGDDVLDELTAAMDDIESGD